MTKNREEVRWKPQIRPIEMPLRTITQEEGVALARKAFKRGQVRDFQTSLLDRITDPVQATLIQA